MSGEPRLTLLADGGGLIAAFVRALDAIPPEPRWAVVGGFAVNLRVSTLHRLTADLDAVAHDQGRLVELIASSPEGVKLDHAKVQIGRSPPVRIDVMDSTDGQPLPHKLADRVFALARRWALAAAEQEEIVVVGPDGSEVAHAQRLVATTEALVAMKVVALKGRIGRASRAKIGTDIHDLVKLVQLNRIDVIADRFSASPDELRAYVGLELLRYFDPAGDGRLALVRLRQVSRGNLDAGTVTLDDLRLLSELGATITAAG